MGSVMRVLVAVCVSVCLAQWLEFWYRFGATDVPSLFWGAILPYALMALVIHIVIEVVPRWPVWVWLLVGSLPGMALEWFVIGNSPWGNPEASQLGMVIFHGAWPIWGRMFDPVWFSPEQRRRALWVMGVAGLLLAPGFLMAPGDIRFVFFIIAPLFAYGALWVIAVKGRGVRSAAG
jgi:hypothetical protein